MNVLSVVLGSDPAGISAGLARAFRNDPEWHFDSYVTKVNYITYPTEPWDARKVRDAWLNADVVHLHHGFISEHRIRGGYLGKRLPKRPYLVHYHGQQFRENHTAYLDELHAKGGVGVVSTLDLAVLSGLEWLPSVISVESMAQTRRDKLPIPNGRIVIAHAPTNRQVKSTQQFIEAIERLQAEGYPVEADIIEHRPWAECLERKARADIFFDQVILGYGNNALEAWGMGIPVIAGAQDETLDEMERRFGHLPFYHATEDTIYDALRELVESPELRERYGKIGHEYVRRFHSEEVVVKQLQGLYRQALGEAEKAA